MSITPERTTPERDADNPVPTREEMGRLVGHLKEGSGPWVGARLFALVAVISMGRLSQTEALELRTDDLTDESGGLSTPKRDGRDGIPRRYGVPAAPPICEPLRRILERWRPRALSPWLFPNQCRVNRWDYSNARDPLSPGVQLLAACRAIGARPFSFRDLRLYGEVEARHLSHPLASPFRVDPGDARCLMTQDLPIGRLRELVVSYYDKVTNYHQERHFRYAFEVVNRMPEVESTADLLTPGFIERFATAAGVASAFARPIHTQIKFLHGIYGHGIRLGCFDVDSFANLPGFHARGVWRDRDWAEIRARRVKARAVSTPRPPVPTGTRPEPGHWDGWDASICPGQVREDGHLLVFGNDKGPIRTKSARQLFKALWAAYPGGFTKAELEKQRIAGDFRGIMTRWRDKDDDCRAAIQLPRVKNGGLYRFGKPD